MSRGAKAGIWILILIVVIVVFVMTARQRLEKEEVQSIEDVQEIEGIPVDVVRVKSIPLEDWREFAGVAEGYEQVDLVAPFRTRIQAVSVKVGDKVEKGKVLVSLDIYDPARFAMNVKTALTQYETVKQDSIRMEALFESGAVSRQNLDHVRASTEAARAQYLTARRAVELDTPIAGVVTLVTVETGDYAEEQQSLITVSSYNRIRITLEMSESERRVIREGQVVRLVLGDTEPVRAQTGEEGDGEIDFAGKSAVLTGEVVKVPLSAHPSTRLYPVEVVVENPDHLLRPGTLVTPDVRVAETAGLPVVPSSAFVRHNNREHIYVVDESGEHPAARLHQVTRGVESSGMVAVTEGLHVGGLVVVWGQNKIEDGVKVKIHDDRTDEYYRTGL